MGDWTIFVLVVLLVIRLCMGADFYFVAKEKGYYSMKFFWYVFLFGLPGYLLVIALPDRGNEEKNVSDELPEI